MFGLPMRIEVPDGPRLVLRAPGVSDGERMAEGFSRREVTRYLMHQRLYTADMERDWVTEIARDEKGYAWGIFWLDDDYPDGLLIGTTSLRLTPGNRGESGFVVFDPRYWGRRVASTAHLARTLYAFGGQLELDAVTSCVQHPNVGSRKALERVGYVVTGRDYRYLVIEGRVRHMDRLLMINPEPRVWDYFWGTEAPPSDFAAARLRTAEALAKARRYVSFEV